MRTEPKDLYSIKPSKFYSRFWKCFSYNFIVGVLALIFVISTASTFNFIIYFTIVFIVLFFLVLPIYRSFKWSSKQVISVKDAGISNVIIFLKKDIQQLITLKKTNLNINLKWEGVRPRILKLTIFDDNNKVLEIFSGGISNTEYELQKIEFVLR